jgi:hypothetical protein
MDEHEGFTPEERWVGAFLEGIQAAQAGQTGLPTVIETKDGPVEGTPTPDGIRFDLPDGRVFEVGDDTCSTVCRLPGPGRRSSYRPTTTCDIPFRLTVISSLQA